MKNFVAGGLALAVDGAPCILAHLHGTHPVAEWVGVVEGRGDDHRTRQVHKAPAAPFAKARQSVF
ncbi:hypothetical protein D3C72_1788790 [compost metagenome]